MLGKYKKRRRSESDVGREGDAAADRQPMQKTTKGDGDGKWAIPNIFFGGQPPL